MSRIIVDDTYVQPPARTSVHGCRPTSPTQRPTRHNCKKEIYQSSFRTYEKTRLARGAKSLKPSVCRGWGKKDDGAWPHLDTRPPVIWTGKIWKLLFGRAVICQGRVHTGPSITVHADFCVCVCVRVCPSMPCYNVIKTATKLVTDNVANTTGYYYVNDILCVLQWTFVGLWQASLGNW